MYRPTPEETEQLARAVRANPVLLKVLAAWRQSELEKLPTMLPANVQVQQGRCLALQEVARLLEGAPERHAAEPISGSRVFAHT